MRADRRSRADHQGLRPTGRRLHLARTAGQLPPALPILFVVVTIIFFVYNPFGGDAWGTPTEGGAIGAFVVF